MNNALRLEKYSFGVGDRFAQQARAQLRACARAAAEGVEVTPVWNKSHREHSIVGSRPAGVRAAAEAPGGALAWTPPFHVDADHIRLETVDDFIASSDFYTLDVADSIGQPAEASEVRAFVARHPELVGRIEIPGVAEPFETTREEIERIASKYLKAVGDAGAIYRHVAARKGEGRFIAEVSMDETDSPQTPPELLVILAAIADEKIPAQTVAPKFTGRFNKGVDYVGDVAQFEKEFNEDIAVIAHAVTRYELPDNLKLSVHSGSDKFSIYAPDGLALAKEIYARALEEIDALCAPYATVIDIDRAKLPTEEEVRGWSSEEFTDALRHDPQNPRYNASLRQLLHVGYKVAAKMGERYLKALEACEETVARNVTENLYERHIDRK